MPPRPETPAKNKPYPKGTICKLQVPVKGKIINPPTDLQGATYEAPKGYHVTIHDVSVLANTGSTEPLTAANAGYRVRWTTTLPEIVSDGTQIESARVKHAALSMRVGGRPSPNIIPVGTIAYLTQPFEYKLRGSHTLPVGTPVIIAKPATTLTGRTTSYAIKTSEAFYTIALTKVQESTFDVTNPSGHLLYHDNLALP